MFEIKRSAPCTIQSMLQRKRFTSQNSTVPEPLKVVILGGSCSARAATNCTDETGDHLSGRYSNILQRAMDKDSQSLFLESKLQVEVINMAQGHTSSIYNGLTMDTLVDAATADILIWEFSPNEGWGVNRRDPHKIQFWLARVQSLFQQAGRPLPPILMVFLWERNIGLEKKAGSIVRDGMDHGVQNALPFIEYYKQQHH